MFFDGIGIDLHFIHEATAASPDETSVFGAYQHAAQRLDKDAKRVVGAFLLEENGRLLNKYQSPYTNPPHNGPATQREHVLLETTHACPHMNFVARIWRTPSVFGKTSAHRAAEPDQVVIQVYRQNGPDANPEIVYRLRPVPFPAHQSSIWIDAGVIDPLPQGNFFITVDRPSRKQTINTVFKRQTVFDAAPGFPGVPMNQQGGLNSRNVIAGTEDERQLQKYITAYMARSSTEQVGSAPPQAPAQASSTETSRPSANCAPQETSPTLSEGSCDSGNNAFQTLLGHVPVGAETNTSASAPPVSTQPTAQVATTSSPSSTTSTQRSPPLASRAWSAIARAASTVAPGRTGTGSASTPAFDAATCPALAQDSQPGKDGMPMFLSAPEQRVDPDTVPNIADKDAPSPYESNDYEGHSSPLGALLEELVGVLQQADTDAAGNQWTEQRQEQGTQTEQLSQASQMVGVSYIDGSNANTIDDTVVSIVQPLVLPSGSGTLAVSSANEEAMPSSNVNASSAPITTAVAGLSIDAGNTTDDVQMEDCERLEPCKNAEDAAAHNGQGGQNDAAVHVDAATIEKASGSTAANPQPGPPDAAHDTEVQDVSHNHAVPASGSQGDAPVVPSSSESEIPLAHLRTTPAPQQDDNASVQGSNAVARRPRSRIAAASQAAESAVARRAGGSRVSASPAQSARSARSARSTRSALALGTARVNKSLEYLMQLVAQDKLKDDQRCLQLNEERTRDTEVYNAARSKYEQDMSTNDIHMQMTRAQLALKHDTIRLLRSQYTADAEEARFRSKTSEGSRKGSERRGRSRSRVTDRAHSVAAASMRMTPQPSIVPPSLIKRERIDLTQDEDDDVVVLGSNNPAGRCNSCAASVARSFIGDRRARAASARPGPIKVGNVGDLMQNRAMTPKRGGTPYPYPPLPRSTPNLGGDNNDELQEIRSHAVKDWVATVDKARAASQACPS